MCPDIFLCIEINMPKRRGRRKKKGGNFGMVWLRKYQPAWMRQGKGMTMSGSGMRMSGSGGFSGMRFSGSGFRARRQGMVTRGVRI